MSRARPTKNTSTEMNEPDPADVQAMRAALKRATRRLNVLELIILSAAAIAAITGGWLAALLAGRAFDFPFRATWVGSSLVLFLLPALVAFLMNRRRQASEAGAAGDHVDSPLERDAE